MPSLRKMFSSRYSIPDLLLSVVGIPAAILLKTYRKMGSSNLPLTTAMLKKVGIFPIRDHYYEPLFNDTHLTHSLRLKRDLPGIDFAIGQQQERLKELTFAQEFEAFVADESGKSGPAAFHLGNGSYDSGDAEMLYQVIRRYKPNKLVEIGSGNSTKIARSALKRNAAETGHAPEHTCIEPFEQPWLESLDGITLVRQKIEDANWDWAECLDAGDILFIDSSHMVRPQGDVLFEYLDIIPRLKSGVIVHVHDIFTPYDYPDKWVRDNVFFWNEQYFLEALLGNTARYEILFALNLLKHEHYGELKAVCPFLSPDREPGSFYFRVR